MAATECYVLARWPSRDKKLGPVLEPLGRFPNWPAVLSFGISIVAFALWDFLSSTMDIRALAGLTFDLASAALVIGVSLGSVSIRQQGFVVFGYLTSWDHVSSYSFDECGLAVRFKGPLHPLGRVYRVQGPEEKLQKIQAILEDRGIERLRLSISEPSVRSPLPPA